ncbi:hypothetical protein ABEF92_006850 [Exophiala dermatitidis]|uniref:PPPDE domain-containing protein n=1 Tax=Exophiala dermatitidis (strain ATCC 34100 / CBS 525.76 / NIH/UT8656) TaxID=858893 RepID=H6C9P7_EXODN|nr:uncharacterized protein HMPREF1120_08707 [Exophiala dermatitidis NIH/UT8656]EHY60763.1 hypothetical protein HMPREF1120_08707 [Exophiala dermatitidis NIH/UT8656]
MATYTVYIVSYTSIPIFHEGIYIEEKAGKGWLYHIIGGHGPGWQYEMKQRNNIENSKQYHDKYVQGKIAQTDFQKVDQVCRTIRMPQNEYRAGVSFQRDCRHWVREALTELENRGYFRRER